MDSFTVSAVFPGPPRRIYDAWISAEGHSAMTGAGATSDPRPGGLFTAWDGYIEGTFVELGPDRIVQTWRSTDFPEGAADSTLDVRFEAVKLGTRVAIVHSDIPPGQGPNYREGWEQFYFTPMRAHFSG